MQRKIGVLNAYVEALVDLYLKTHQKVEILDSLGTTDIVDRLQNSHGAHAFDALVNALAEDIIRSTWAFALDPAEGTPSLVNTWRLANQAGVLPALRERFVTAQSTNSAQRQGRLGYAKIQSQQFDAAVGRLTQMVPAITSSPQANKFVTARHKGIAHHEMRSVAGGGPKRFDLRNAGIAWEGLREFVESTASLVSDLALIVTGTDYQIAGIHEHHRINVEDFWMRIMGNGTFELR